MPKYEKFEDLPAWQEGARLYNAVLDILETPNPPFTAGFRNQLDRAAISVSNNIAEGFERTTTAELLNLINSLNTRDDVDGILTQLPLPAGIDETAIIEAIDPAKDVDGFHPVNVGKLMLGDPTGFHPCTPAGIRELLARSQTKTEGAEVVVLGREDQPAHG